MRMSNEQNKKKQYENIKTFLEMGYWYKRSACVSVCSEKFS